MPKVSICIPAYEQVEYLKRTLDSILMQDFTDYEIILTDDSVSDKVKKLVKGYDFGGRLKYFKNHNRLGSPKNWNEAISRSSGEYIKIVHHDDWFAEENSLSEFVNVLDQNPSTDFAFSGCKNIKGNKKIPHPIIAENVAFISKAPYQLLLGNIIGAPSVTIFRKNINCFFDEHLKWLVDLDFYIQVLQKNPEFVVISEQLMNICSSGPHQVTNECQNNRDIELSEYIFLYNKYNDKIKLDYEHKYFLSTLYGKYGIKSLKDLMDVNLISEIPRSIKKTFSNPIKFKSLVKKFIVSSFKRSGLQKRGV